MQEKCLSIEGDGGRISTTTGAQVHCFNWLHILLTSLHRLHRLRYIQSLGEGRFSRICKIESFSRQTFLKALKVLMPLEQIRYCKSCWHLSPEAPIQRWRCKAKRQQKQFFSLYRSRANLRGALQFCFPSATSICADKLASLLGWGAYRCPCHIHSARALWCLAGASISENREGLVWKACRHRWLSKQ